MGVQALSLHCINYDAITDEGITGTKKEKRPQLRKMMADCKAGKIDFIVTKSISRFSRNTADCLELTRKLLTLNIPVYFEKEDINTGAMESELFLSILSSMAQNESVSISQNGKWSVQKRFESGTFKISYPPYGYDWNGEKMVINPAQAQVVKQIFSETLSGKSSPAIAKELNAGHIPSRRSGHWTSTTVRDILANEKYMGDALLQKTYTVDFLTKKRIKNNGTVPQYYVEADHEAIIPKDIFMQVQEELVRRRVVYVSPSGRKRNFSCSHPFAQMVYCGECGELYRRIHWYNRGKKSIVWRCISRLESTSAKEPCRNRTVNETVLQNVSIKAVNRIEYNKVRNFEKA